MNEKTSDAIDLVNASDDDLKSMGLPPAFTLEELKTFMTDEEIEREFASEDPLVKRPGDDGNDDDDEDGDEDDGQDVGTAAATSDDVPDPVYKPTDVSAHKAVIDGAAAERKAIRDKYADGDLTDEEFDAQLDAVGEKVNDAKIAIKDAAHEDKQALGVWQNAWYERVSDVTKANPALTDNTAALTVNGGQYSVYQVFDHLCREVNSRPEYVGLSHKQRAEAAAEMTKAFYKQQTGKDLVAPAAKTDKTPAEAAKPAPEKSPAEKVKEAGKRPAPVQTLGGITAASETEVTDSKFAGVDTASGMEAERAYGAMSAAERDAYLAGS